MFEWVSCDGGVILKGTQLSIKPFCIRATFSTCRCHCISDTNLEPILHHVIALSQGSWCRFLRIWCDPFICIFTIFLTILLFFFKLTLAFKCQVMFTMYTVELTWQDDVLISAHFWIWIIFRQANIKKLIIIIKQAKLITFYVRDSGPISHYFLVWVVIIARAATWNT